MRMPRAQFWFQPNLERGILNPFVKLEKMRMCCADTDPDYLHVTFGWKCSDALDLQKERAEINCAELLAQGKFDIFAHVGKKPESKMDLIVGRPAHAANVRVEIDQNFAN